VLVRVALCGLRTNTTTTRGCRRQRRPPLCGFSVSFAPAPVVETTPCAFRLPELQTCSRHDPPPPLLGSEAGHPRSITGSK